MNPLLIRRRGMMMAQQNYNFVPMVTLDYKSWTKGTRVSLSGDWVVFSPITFNWSCNLTGRICLYTYGDLPSKIFRISCDYDISGMSSGDEMALSVGTYDSNDPGTGARRYFCLDAPTIAANGVGHFESIFEALIWSGSPRDNQFVDIRAYFHAHDGAIGKLKNITFDVHAPN